MKNKDSYLGRRRFLCGMVGTGGMALGAISGGPLAAYVANLQNEPLPEFIVLEPPEYELEAGQSKILRYGPLPILLVRPMDPDSSLRVFVATCTHFDCIVGYRREENLIVCACHDGRFRPDGKVVSGPPPAPLVTVYCVLRGDQLVLALEKQNLEKAL